MKIGVWMVFGILALAILISGCGEQAQPTQPTCNSPYILVGTSCCLDQNSNDICDSDEADETAAANNTGQAAGNQSAANENAVNESLWSKDSGYTVAECQEVCNLWDTLGEVSSCKDVCINHYGKPSHSLDLFVEISKNAVGKNSKYKDIYLP